MPRDENAVQQQRAPVDIGDFAAKDPFVLQLPGSAASANRPQSPSVPKIPNFARALSGSGSNLLGRSGSLSAREAERPIDYFEARRPLTSRPATVRRALPA